LQLEAEKIATEWDRSVVEFPFCLLRVSRQLETGRLPKSIIARPSRA